MCKPIIFGAARQRKAALVTKYFAPEKRVKPMVGRFMKPLATKVDLMEMTRDIADVKDGVGHVNKAATEWRGT